MKFTTSLEKAYWTYIYECDQSRSLEASVQSAVADGRCQPHFLPIWETHVRDELVTRAEIAAAEALETPIENVSDIARKLAVIEARFDMTAELSVALALLRDEVERVAQSDGEGQSAQPVWTDAVPDTLAMLFAAKPR